MTQHARNARNPAAQFLTGSALLREMLADHAPAAPAPKPAPKPVRVSTDPDVRAILALADVAPSHVTPAPAPKVATPAPKVATPAPKVATPAPKLTATWGRLPGDVWGVRCAGGSEGDKVTVVTKAGKRSTVTLGREVKPGLFEKVGRQSKAKPRAKRQRVCPGNNNCRRFGWRKGRRCAP